MISWPRCLHFEDDGRFPNSRLAVLLYSAGLVAEPDQMEAHLAARNWSNSWRGGIYSFHHYHSLSHEALAVYAGWGRLRLGGPRLGQALEVQSGDVLILPAGVAHQCVQASPDFAVVGAYPDGRGWDLLRGRPDERPAADRRVASLPVPDQDPIHGHDGPLGQLWR
ncbi:MAG: cupin [Vulcanimicrobiota bacterium]